MTIHDFLAPAAEACQRTGPHDDIVMSSRVRLARNLRKQPFPSWAKKPDRMRVLEAIQPEVEGLPQLAPESQTKDSSIGYQSSMSLPETMPDCRYLLPNLLKRKKPA